MTSIEFLSTANCNFRHFVLVFASQDYYNLNLINGLSKIFFRSGIIDDPLFEEILRVFLLLFRVHRSHWTFYVRTLPTETSIKTFFFC